MAATSFDYTSHADPPQGASPVPQRPSDDARIRQLVKDLYTPLDHPARPAGSRPANDDELLEREERELERARAAAQRAFKVRPALSTRKAAAMILSTGAMSLTAFTTPFVAEQSASPHHARAGKRQFPDDLRASDKLKQALTEEEGVRHTVYRDVAGYPTVGVGHLVRPGDGLAVGDRISEAQARAFLDADIRSAEAAARELLGGLPVHQHEFDALVDLIYNVGPGNVSPQESPNLNRAIAEGDYEGIATELEYTFAGGAYARGLDHRSERRMQMFRQAAYEDPRLTGRVDA